jgi:hypothetical protein
LTWGILPLKKKKREAKKKKKEEEKISKNWGSVHRQCLA